MIKMSFSNHIFYEHIIFDVNKKMYRGITIKQGDTGSRGFFVKVIPIDISDKTMTCYCKKPDGTKVYIDAVKDGDKFRVDLTNQVSAVPGKVECELTLKGPDDEIISGKTFSITVEPSLQYGSMLSQNELSDFGRHLADYASLFIDNPDAKNSIYRGKYLGDTVTAEQYTAISSGTFTDLYIGDYWTIGDVNWRIAAFNYYRNTGDTNVPGNHIVVVPDQLLYSHVMNDTNTTEGGYTGSKMYTEGLEEAKTIINNAFPGHVLTFRAYLCNAVSNGEASAGGWFDSTVDLMNEIMVYGSVVNGAATYGLYNIGSEKSQLPLFRLAPRFINTRYRYWLRDVVSDTSFACVYASGSASYVTATAPYDVRPRFLIS